MIAEIRGDVADAKVSIGRAIVVVREALAGQGLLVPGRPLAVLAEDAGGVGGGMKMRGVDDVAVNVGLGGKLECLAIAVQGFVDPALVFEDAGEVVEGIGAIRSDLDGGAIAAMASSSRPWLFRALPRLLWPWRGWV